MTHVCCSFVVFCSISCNGNVSSTDGNISTTGCIVMTFKKIYTDIHGPNGWLPLTLVIARLFLPYSGRPCQLLDSLSLTFVQIFMVPRGWITMTLLIPCPLAPPAGQNFHLLNNISSCSTTTRLTFMVWVKYQHLFDGLQLSFLQTAILFRIIAITLVISWLLI